MEIDQPYQQTNIYTFSNHILAAGKSVFIVSTAFSWALDPSKAT